jgi:hypothetical protein
VPRRPRARLTPHCSGLGVSRSRSFLLAAELDIVRPLQEHHDMRHSATSRCHLSAHPEILVSYAESGVIPDDVDNLIRTLEAMVATGSVFAPGETIQVGWLYDQFREQGQGVLTLYEPDLKAFPVSWVPGITNTLVTKRLQLDVADSFGLREQAEFTTFRHSCLICSQFRAGIDFLMSRVSPENAISGWFIGCLDERHDHNSTNHLLCLSTYELITRVSSSPLSYLALPPDVVVEVKNELPRVALSDKPLEIARGSFVEALYRRAQGAV